MHITSHVQKKRKKLLHVYTVPVTFRSQEGDKTCGRIPSPTGDLSQGIRVRGRWRRWATTALVRRDRWEGGGGRATVPARVLFT
jgi:hypothetical protein